MSSENDTGKPKRDTRFKPGNNGHVKARKNKELQRKEDIAQFLANIPDSQAHIKPLLAPLAEQALKGDRKAFEELKSLGVLDITPEPTPAGDSLRKRPIGDDNLPQACRQLREELDLPIAYIVQRYEMGLPCSEAEKLLAETSLAVRDSGLKGRAAQRGERIAKAWARAMQEEV